MEDPLIKVEDIQVQLSEPKGAWDEFYKISGDRETDSRLDTATVFLKELIVVVKGGFKETNSRLGSMDGKLDKMDGKLDRIAKAQENIADRIDMRQERDRLRGEGTAPGSEGLRLSKAFEEEGRSSRKSNRHQSQDAAKAKLILEEQLYLFPERQRIARDVKDRCLKKKPWKR